MSGKVRLAAAGMVLCAAGAAARADVVNGDFGSGTDHWNVTAWWLNAGDAVADVVSVGGNNKLHLYVKNTYQWVSDGGWHWELQELDEGDPFPSTIRVYQEVLAEGGSCSPGDTILRFTVGKVDAALYTPGDDGSMSILGDAPDVDGKSHFMVEVKPEPGTAESTSVHAEGTYDIAFVPPSGSSPKVTIRVYFDNGASWLTDFTSADLGGVTSVTVKINAYLDDFHFLPEPGALSLLAVGAGLVLLRRRARR